MKKLNKKTLFLVTSALIAAGYTALTYMTTALGLSFGGVQFRISEALNILALFTPAAIPGLTLGCLLSNLASPFGPIDIVLGTIATLLSALIIRLISKSNRNAAAPFLAAIPPTLFNAIIVGFEIAIFTPEQSFLTVFGISALQVGLGEAAVCLLLGVPLYFLLNKNRNRLF